MVHSVHPVDAFDLPEWLGTSEVSWVACSGVRGSSWTLGQVLLLEYDGRLTLAVPGTAYSADGALETISRFAKAMGVRPGHFTVTLRL